MYNSLKEIFNSRQSLKKGTTIRIADAFSNNIFLLLDGFVKESVVNASGVEVTTRIIKPQIIFPLAQPAESDSVQFIYECYTDAVVISAPFESFNQVLEKHPEFLKELYSSLIGQVVDFKKRLLYLNNGDALAKVVFILGYLARNFSNDGNEPVEIPLSQKEIGLFIGLSRESVGMQIKKLAEEGRVSFKHNRLVINPEYFLDRSLMAGI